MNSLLYFTAIILFSFCYGVSGQYIRISYCYNGTEDQGVLNFFQAGVCGNNLKYSVINSSFVGGYRCSDGKLLATIRLDDCGDDDYYAILAENITSPWETPARASFVWPQGTSNCTAKQAPAITYMIKPECYPQYQNGEINGSINVLCYKDQQTGTHWYNSSDCSGIPYKSQWSQFQCLNDSNGSTSFGCYLGDSFWPPTSY